MKFIIIYLLSFSLFAYDLSNTADYSASAELNLLEKLDFEAAEGSAFLESTKGLHQKDNDKDLAKIVIVVNRAPKGTAQDAQRAKVYMDGVLVRTFKVSTGKAGRETRLGYFRPVHTKSHLRVYKNYYSGKYGSRMAKAIFFYGGYAIHHTDAVSRLGRRASHGCVRFHIDDITWINDQVMALGNPNPEEKKWRHARFKGTKKYNVHYTGLAKKVHPIGRFSGVIDYTRKIKSLDVVILIKDQRD